MQKLRGLSPRDRLVMQVEHQNVLVNWEEDEGNFLVWWTLTSYEGSCRQLRLEANDPLTGLHILKTKNVPEMEDFWKIHAKLISELREDCANSTAGTAQNAVEAPTAT